MGRSNPVAKGLTAPEGVTTLTVLDRVVGDVEVASRVEGQGGGIVESGGDDPDCPRRRDLPHLAGTGVSDVEVAGRVEGQSGRQVEPGEEADLRPPA